MCLDFLTTQQKTLLNKGSLHAACDVILVSSQELARKCGSSVREAQEIIDALYRTTRPVILAQLEVHRTEGSEVCTTGDSTLDRLLGGGIRPAMIWEIAGESAAGKTQLAIQLSLFAQLPKEQGGLSGSTCYLTTSSKLPTPRFVQIMRAHPLLSDSDCSLDNVHTLTTPTVSHLVYVLSQTLPSLIYENQQGKELPLKLVIIDALGELFHRSDKNTTTTLVERARDIVEISALLHSVAHKHRLAIVVLNEVIDTFDRPLAPDGGHEVYYNEQSRWFGQAQSKEEVSLGLVWANQVNARIFLSRTDRRRYPDEVDSRPSKRVKANRVSATPATSPPANDSIAIRRLSIIFSPVSRPASCDYIVTGSGIMVINS